MRDRTNNSRLDGLYPRSVDGLSSVERQKNASISDSVSASIQGATPGSSIMNSGQGADVSRVPGRRYYDPTLMSSALYLPRDFRLKNKWRRWFYTHDPVTGMVLDMHSEFPHSSADVLADDSTIKRITEEMFDAMDLFSTLPSVDLEFMKIGEVTLYDLFDTSKGYFTKTVIHNPDFVEVSASQLSPDNQIVELRPSNDLKRLVMSTNPRDIKLKKKIDKKILARVATGRNIPLEPEFTTRLTRLANPYDIRGTSMIDRLFRWLMYEDKLAEANITVADNFIFPLKIFKLGDPTSGWVPDESHMLALQELLLQQQFDPNFSLIFHYGLTYERHGFEGQILRLDREWEQIDKMKLTGLGVSKEFIEGTSTYASANAALQVLLARYQSKRYFFQQKWINKLLKYVAKENDWYRRDKRELVGRFRVKRNAQERADRLIVPKLSWHKKLSLRDDQTFLGWLNTFYQNGNGPVSTSTVLASAGFDFEDELRRKKQDELTEQKIGQEAVKKPESGGGGFGLGLGGEEMSLPGAEAPESAEYPEASFKKFKDKVASFFKFGKDKDKNDFYDRLDKELRTNTELRRALNIDFFVGKSKSAILTKSEDKEKGILINTSSLDRNEVDYFFNTFNTHMFQSRKVFSSYINSFYDEYVQDNFFKLHFSFIDNIFSKDFSSFEQPTDLKNTLRDYCLESWKNESISLYKCGKIKAYRDTNYIVKKMGSNQENIGYDSFIDKIVIEENILLFDYLLSTILRKIAPDYSLEEFSQNKQKIKECFNLFFLVISYYIFLIGCIKGFEEQSFEKVHCIYPSIDLLNTSENIKTREISSILREGENSFSFLFDQSILPIIEPVYTGNTNVHRTNIKKSYYIQNCPYIYANSISELLTKVNTNFSNIKFVNDLSEVQDKVNNYVTSKLKSIEDDQLRVAMLNKYSYELKNKSIIDFDDTLVIQETQLKDANMFNSLLEYLSKYYINEFDRDMYNFKESDFKKYISEGIFKLTNDGLYKISTTNLPSSIVKNKNFLNLFNLCKDFNMMKSVAWNSSGQFISDFTTLDDKDYFKRFVLSKIKFPHFYNKYYGQHVL